MRARATEWLTRLGFFSRSDSHLRESDSTALEPSETFRCFPCVPWAILRSDLDETTPLFTTLNSRAFSPLQFSGAAKEAGLYWDRRFAANVALAGYRSA